MVMAMHTDALPAGFHFPAGGNISQFYLLSLPEHRVDRGGGGLAISHDIAAEVDALRPAVTIRELGKATGNPSLINPGVFVIVVLRPPNILFPAHDNPVRVDVLHVRGETSEAAAGNHHVLIEQEPTEEIQLLALGIAPWTQAAGNLPLGVDCRGIAEPHVARGGIGSNVLERAGSPLEGMEPPPCHPARPYNGAPLIDIFGL